MSDKRMHESMGGSKKALLRKQAKREIEEELYPALVSEKSLSKDWLTEEEDSAWENLRKKKSIKPKTKRKMCRCIK